MTYPRWNIWNFPASWLCSSCGVERGLLALPLLEVQIFKTFLFKYLSVELNIMLKFKNVFFLVNPLRHTHTQWGLIADSSVILIEHKVFMKINLHLSSSLIFVVDIINASYKYEILSAVLKLEFLYKATSTYSFSGEFELKLYGLINWQLSLCTFIYNFFMSANLFSP